MKKEVLLPALFFTILFSSFLVSAVADVAYVYRKSFRVDENIIQAFSDMNLTVDLIQENDLPVDFSQYNLIFVGDENFRKENLIYVNNYPSIVANYYHMASWGYTDEEGASQLAATQPLSVLKDGRTIRVYTQAVEWIGGPSISYYFLDAENKASNLTTVALTQPSDGGDLGDVISYASPGTPLFDGKTQNAKMCFYGIIESDYWTPAARDLFYDCIGYVAAECTTDSDCPGPTYSEPFCQDRDVYKTETSYTCEDGVLAKCVPHESLVFIESCPYDCLNGMCVGECETDSECGTDGFIGDLFCIDNNVSQAYQIPSCLSPGLANATCSSYTINQTIEICADVCISGECFNVTCSSDEDCDDSNSSTQDICHNPGLPSSFCTNEPIRCFTDENCGIDGFIGSPFCNNGNVEQVFRNFICNNPGVASSYCSHSDESLIIEECDEGCFNGTCIDIVCYSDAECDDSNPLTFDQCINPGTVVSECRNTPINCASDEDCGFTGFIGEEFCLNDNIAKNFKNATCINPGQLSSACNIEIVQSILDICDYACFDSVCIRCDENSDCDDSNPTTVDICHSPGNLTSYCSNEPTSPGNITCATDSQCGPDEPISPLFCFSGNVNQLVMAWTCNYPNTTESYCSSDIEIELVETCEQYCTDGECISIECFNHEDCDDLNESTLDICNNPGTPDSFCTNTPKNITCSTDSWCGTDVFLGENFCLNNDVLRLFREYTCNSPGTTISFCSSSIYPKLIEECQYACFDGTCIRCDENSDCDDSDSSTNDVCIFPGTLLSYCENNPTGDCTPGQTRQCGITNVGECEFGTETCQSTGYWGSCTGAVYPEIEICDGLDNDCDGETDEGVCPPVCEDECVFGERDCFGNSPRICGQLDTDPCTEWVVLPPCEPGETCVDGYCVSSCTNQCTFGERRCYGDGFQICGYYDSDDCTEWSMTTSCSTDETCVDGYCVSSCEDECVFGARECVPGENGWHLCGLFDSDPCTEWSMTIICGDLKSCQGGACI